MKNKRVALNMDDILLFLYASIFFLVIGIVILVAVSGAKKNIALKENANFVEVEATIVEYRKIVNSHRDYNGHTTESIHYSTFYEYITADGGSYMAYWQSFETEEEAKLQLGMKVPIYIDDDLKLQAKSLEIDKSGITIGFTLGSVLIVASVSSLTAFVVLTVRRKRYIEKQRQLYSGMEDFDKPKGSNSLQSMIMTISLLVLAISIAYHFVNEKKYQTYVNVQFEEVNATAYEYREFVNPKDNSIYYAMMYKYVSDNGEEFIGVWRNDIYSEEDAIANLGASVPLIYNENYGALKSLLYLDEVDKPNHTAEAIAIAISAVVFGCTFVRFTVRNIRVAKYDKEHEKNDDSFKLY